MRSLKLLAIIGLLIIFYVETSFSQTEEKFKSSGIDVNLLIPIGDLGKAQSYGFMIGDLTRWDLNENMKILGRIELGAFGAEKETLKDEFTGMEYTTYTEELLAVIIGSGFQYELENNAFILFNFPSINYLYRLRVGAGIGGGLNMSWGKSQLGIEGKFNIYNLFFTREEEKTLMTVGLGFWVAL